MPRTARTAPGGFVYHVLNRTAGKKRIFRTPGDYLTFLEAVGETQRNVPMRILSFCIMPNHWHFVLWPEKDDSLGVFMHRLTTLHVSRWKQYHEAIRFALAWCRERKTGRTAV